MLVIENYCDEVLKSNNYAALGSFDGLHKGHISLIEKTVELAKKEMERVWFLRLKIIQEVCLIKIMFHVLL